MHYLRLLTNSLLGGVLVGGYVTVIVLQLNPALPLISVPAAWVILTWWAFYGISATVFFYALIAARQLLAGDLRSPAWLSLRVLAVFGTIAMSFASVVTWLNLRGFRPALEPGAASRMTIGALLL